MATQPGAAFDSFLTGNELNQFIASLPPGIEFDNLFDGRDGAPTTLTGTPEDDVFYAQPGDTVIGGGGYDVVVGFPDAAGNVPNLNLDPSVEGAILTGTGDADVAGNDNSNAIAGNAGDNALLGEGGDDGLIGGDGSDVLIGGGGNDQVFGGNGDDFIKGGAGNDSLDGGEGADTIHGGTGQDSLFGLGGDDMLFGGPEADTLLGGPGKDTLFGSQGADTLTGEKGKDTFTFERGDGSDLDTITDFKPGKDKIDLTDFNTKFGKLKFKNDGDDVVVTVGKGSSAVKFKLLGFHKNDIDSSFFQF